MNSTCEPGRHSARTLKPYPDYKDSGVQWLGKVPSHWAVRRIRTIASLISGATPSSNTGSYWDGDIVWVTPHDLGALGSRYTTTSARRITRKGYEACGATMAPAGSVAISTRAPIGHTGILSSGACTNQGCRLLVPNGAIQPEHLYYSLKVARPELESLGQGSTFAELSRDELARFAVPVAPRREQAAIVRFLDYTDRRIRRYIRAKQKLIALLEEQKQAVIHEAVTGRIDVRTGRPYPAYRDSGVEWLGVVPSYWQVRRIGGFCRVGNGSTPSRSNPGYWFKGDYPWLNSSCVNRGSIEGADQFVTSQALRECHLPRVPANSVLIGITGQGRTRGMAAMLRFGATINQHLAYVTPNAGKMSSSYLHMYLTAAYSELRALSSASGSTKDALTCEGVKLFRVPLPPVDEQEVLLSVVGQRLNEVERCASDTRRQIDLVQKYRVRLIADVVTGKLDVREAPAGLPDVDPLAAERDADVGDAERSVAAREFVDDG